MEFTGILIGLGAGAVLSFLLFNLFTKRLNKKKIDELNNKADLTLKEAKLSADRVVGDAEQKARSMVDKAKIKNEQIKQQKIQEAKDKFNNLRVSYENYKADQKVELKEREIEVVSQEKELELKVDKYKTGKEILDQNKAEVKTIKENLDKQLQIIAKKRGELENANEKIIRELENIARLSESDAKEQLLEAVKAKSETDALAIQKSTLNAAKLTANKEAKRIIIHTIQRMVAEYTIENTVSVFNLDSDDIKGQIIGREGRNIRALEAATGAEIVVDDTPEAIVISSFDPIRREICRLSLKRLVADGRIHPARIEEVVTKVKKELDEKIVEIGERVIIDLDIHGLDPYLVKMIGRMRFRSSYGQNLLKHSIETAKLCALMAAELGLSPKEIKREKRAGLLPVMEISAKEKSEFSIALFGLKFCKN